MLAFCLRGVASSSDVLESGRVSELGSSSDNCRSGGGGVLSRLSVEGADRRGNEGPLERELSLREADDRAASWSFK